MGIFTSTPPLVVTKKQPRAEKQFNPAYWKGLLESVEVARRRLSPLLARDAQKRADLGQFFTPVAVAEFMASLIRPRSDLYRVRLLDAGSGNGMLIAAAIEKMLHWETPPREIACVCWEIDPDLTDELSITLDLCRSACRARGVSFFSDLRRSDFILDASTSLKSDLFGSNDLEFDLAILNPPYRKLRTESVERIRLNRLGIETSNLYAAFMWLASKLLAAQGQLIGITPRSYMNGTYFRPFRTALLSELSVEHIHVYVARDIPFSDDEV